MQTCRFYRLPVEVQREIESRLAANGFSDYVAITEELRKRGYRIGKSALHRVGQKLKRAATAAPAQRHALIALSEAKK